MKVKSHLKAALLFICFSQIAEGALLDGVTLEFSPAPDSGSTQPTSGSWWGLDFFTTTLFTPLTSFDGIILGQAQPASGSHFGLPDGTENLSISEPILSSGATGMFQSTSPITVISSFGNTATLDFSGFGMTWNGIPNISLSGDPTNFPDEMGIATVTCSIDCSIGDSYILDYTAHEVPEIGGQLHTIHLEGSIVQTVPLPATFWLFCSGGLLLVSVIRDGWGQSKNSE